MSLQYLKILSSILFCAFMSFGFAQEKINPLPYQLIEKDNHQIHLLDIDPHDFKIMVVSAKDEEQGRKEVSSFVEQYKALAGINGGYFYISNKGQGKPAGAFKMNHQWYGYQRIARGAIGWNEDNNNVLIDRIITKKSNQQSIPAVEVLPQLDSSPQVKKSWQEFSNIIGGIPVLIKNGKAITDYKDEKAMTSFIKERHARTAVCIKDNHHWLFLVASHTKEPDRPYTSKVVEGLTISELAQILLSQGCQDAINLDGGGSSTLVLDDKTMNTPAGDMDEFLHLYHERPVSDAIIVLPR